MMKRFARIDPSVQAPQQVLAIVEGEAFSASPTLLSLVDTPDVNERAWYLPTEGRFIEPRPTAAHVWSSAGWVLDEVQNLKGLADTERAWRDQVTPPMFALRDRHRDEVELGIETTLTAEQFAELLAYVQALRDWPQSAAFPDVAQRPIEPTWIAGQIQ